MHKTNNKRHSRYAVASAFMLAFVFGAPAAAAGNSMKTGNRTSQPIGHYEYCKANVRDCQIRTSNLQPVQLTRKRWSEIVEINAHANSVIRPVTDADYYGVEELWTYPVTHGDCEDYALMKRRELMRLGWPASSLLVTVVRQKNGDGHAVLTVRTDRGDYVLDNLRQRIKLWHETEYTFLKRQMAAHSGYWEDIIDTRKMVGSVR